LLIIVDSFCSYYLDVDGRKEMVALLSHLAIKEGRAGITAIIDIGFFFVFGGENTATQLTNYDTSLAPKGEGSIIKSLAATMCKTIIPQKRYSKRSACSRPEKSCLR
jgi:hypothetical protein